MRSTTATIFLGNLRHNLDQVRQSAKKSKILAAVKANAYGHGALKIAQTLQEEGVDYLGVATMDEASELRRGKITLPILLLGISNPKEIENYAGMDLSYVISDAQYLEMIGEATRGLKRQVPLHLKIDVGMGRLGSVPDEALMLAQAIKKYPHLYWEGLMTHFPSSDNGMAQPTLQQHETFLEVLNLLETRGFQFDYIHAANSGAILDHPQTHGSMIRPGILLYGYTPSYHHPKRKNFFPVMQLESQLVLLKHLPRWSTVSYGQTYSLKTDSYVGVVGCGYADGYFRGLSNKGRVRIAEELYTVSGRVCMDLLMLDLGPTTQTRRWDPVVLFGPWEQGPDAWDLAQILDTIPYEITCAVSKRVPRLYVDELRYFR